MSEPTTIEIIKGLHKSSVYEPLFYHSDDQSIVTKCGLTFYLGEYVISMWIKARIIRRMAVNRERVNFVDKS